MSQLKVTNSNRGPSLYSCKVALRIICSALFVLTTVAAYGGGAIVESYPEKWISEAEAAYDRVESYTAIFHKQQRIAGKPLLKRTYSSNVEKDHFPCI